MPVGKTHECPKLEHALTPTYQTRQLGWWPYASNYDAPTTPLASVKGPQDKLLIIEDLNNIQIFKIKPADKQFTS